MIAVDGRTLSYDDVVAVAHGHEQVALPDGVLDRLKRDRAVVEDIVDRGIPTYGLTTGLGTRSSYALPREELELFSVRTVRGGPTRWAIRCRCPSYAPPSSPG